MSTQERVMLLIDADNVSVDVMEQAVRLVHQQHGGLHVRRAYCTAESAVKHQAVFKRLSIKPMVNLAAGKNSTDIALAVDAIDLVLAERPDVVVIASSDSDFAPLVQRLREKGCVVRGIGQQGKTGAETVEVYDDFTVLEHRGGAADSPARKRAPSRAGTSSRPAGAKPLAGSAAAKAAAVGGARAAGKPAERKAAKAAARPAAPEAGDPEAGVARQEAVPAADLAAGRSADDATADAATGVVATAPPAPAAGGKAAKAKPARKTTRKPTAETPTAPAAAAAVSEPAAAAKAPRKRATRPEAAAKKAAAPAPAPIPAPAPAPAAKAAVPATGSSAPAARPDLDAVLACLPELASGQPLAINVAVQRLREARLLGRNTPSTKFFAALAERLELRPAGKPSQVLLRR